MSLLDLAIKEGDINKKRLLLKLAANSCKECNLHEGRKNVVLANGLVPNWIAFVGEAPGKNEDEQGKPFVGDSGELLNRLLLIAGLKREDITIFNTVCCRPPQNRTPKPEEMSACSRIFDEQLKIVSPNLIVTLGSMALQKFKPGAKITAIHGKGFVWKDKIVFPTFHPAAALRQSSYLRLLSKDFIELKRLFEAAEKIKVEIWNFEEQICNSAWCPVCHHSKWWISKSGVRVCGICHPPASPELVARWEGEQIEGSGFDNGTNNIACAT